MKYYVDIYVMFYPLNCPVHPKVIIDHSIVFNICIPVLCTVGGIIGNGAHFISYTNYNIDIFLLFDLYFHTVSVQSLARETKP